MIQHVTEKMISRVLMVIVSMQIGDVMESLIAVMEVMKRIVSNHDENF